MAIDSFKLQDRFKIFPSHVYKSGQSVYAGLSDSAGVFYFGTSTGIVEYDGERWDKIFVNNYREVLALEPYKKSDILVGASEEFGILRKQTNGEYNYYSLRTQLSDTIRVGEIWEIIEYNEDVYFVSYYNIFRYRNNKLEVLNIENSHIKNIGGNLYISKLGGKISKFEDDKIIELANSPVYEYDLVFEVFPFGKNQYLLLYSENQAVLFNPLEERFTPIEMELNNYITKKFLNDAKVFGDFMVVGSWFDGAAITDLKGNNIIELNQNTPLFRKTIYKVIKGHNNDLWFATHDGLVHLDLDDFNDSKEEAGKGLDDPELMVREVKLGDSILFHGGLNEGKHMPEMMQKLPDSNLEITFEYAVPGYSDDDFEYSVLLVNKDKDWSSWRNEAFKSYSNLPGGDYQFKVRGRNSKSEEVGEVSIYFTVKPKWYLTLWGKAVITLSVFIVIYFIIQIRTNQLNTQNKKLEKLVELRTVNLVQQQDKLENLNKNLTNTNRELDSFVYHTSHDLKAPLKSVLGLIDLAERDTKEEMTRVYLGMMEKSIHKLEEFISSIIEYSANAKSDIHINEINFNSLLDECLNGLKYHQNFDSIRQERSINVNGNFKTDEKRLLIILNNLLSNAVKYHDLIKEDPYLKVSVFQQNGQASIQVEDNGKGIDDAHHDGIFDMFFRASEDSYGSGLGLYIVKETVIKLNGNISLDSQLGRGSTFTIELPNLA